VDAATCPVIWGEPAPTRQHAFFQLLHQGTDPVPVDFIVAREAARPVPGHQTLLIANCLAQGAALMLGRSTEAVAREMLDAGVERGAGPRTGTAPHLSRQPAEHDPGTARARCSRAGCTAARLYEHKTFTQGVIWGLNSFDQWGVELGKQLAGRVATQLAGSGAVTDFDPSTAALIERLR
jgi:glucose-6-phosphate isomerase